MTVGGVHTGLRPTRRAARPGHLTPQPAPRIPRDLPPLPFAPGQGGGDWTPDLARARYDAARALEAIDWSKKDIYIWVPGTDNHTINPGFEAAVRDANQNGSASLSRIEYEASWRMRPSVATGIETLRLVLAGIQAHGGSHRVLVAGESQGAWILGEAMADPLLSKVVTRAVIFGHPTMATHHYEDGHDPKVLEVNHVGDEVAMPINGDMGKAMDAMSAVRQGKIGALPSLLGPLLKNSEHGVALLGSFFRWLIPTDLFKDPHNYTSDMTMAVQYLQTGRR